MRLDCKTYNSPGRFTSGKFSDLLVDETIDAFRTSVWTLIQSTLTAAGTNF